MDLIIIEIIVLLSKLGVIHLVPGGTIILLAVSAVLRLVYSHLRAGGANSRPEGR